jgi:hypothetical protein
MGEERTDEPQANQRLTVAQAAVTLGLNEGAVRSRIKRGTLPTVKEGRTVYVILGGGTSKANQSTDTDEPSGGPTDQSKLVESLQDQVSYLRGQLDAERSANMENRRLLAAALERIPAIEPPEARESPETVREDEGGDQVSGEGTGEPRRERSWWRRFWGME